MFYNKFRSRDAAWEFMRQCDAKGIPAGYPFMENDGRYLVKTEGKDLCPNCKKDRGLMSEEVKSFHPVAC